MTGPRVFSCKHFHENAITRVYFNVSWKRKRVVYEKLMYLGMKYLHSVFRAFFVVVK